jgi:CheY-like chemotaxis protein
MNSMEPFFSKVKILVVDDSDIIRVTLSKFLSEYDIEVITCTDGLEGIQKSIECKPNLIILDLYMPNLDGIKMLRVLKVLNEVKIIPVIVISGHTDKGNVLAAMEAGAEKVISKPLSKEVLVKNINEVLGNSFLSSVKKVAHLSAAEKENMNQELRRYFIKSLFQKRDTLRQALVKKNADLLKLVVHELKGSSGTVGLTNIMEICIEVERIIASSAENWTVIKSKCDSLFDKLNEIETSFAK